MLNEVYEWSHQLASVLYFVFMCILFDFPADVVTKFSLGAKGHPLGVQCGKTGTSVPHGVQRITRGKVTYRSGAEARTIRPSPRLLFSDVLHLAQLSIDTHRSVCDKPGAEARISPTATQRLPDSSLIASGAPVCFADALDKIATHLQ